MVELDEAAGTESEVAATESEVAATEPGPKVYTMEEVQKHVTQDDCWLVIKGKVYDTTAYLEDHPGGVDVMLQSSGRDATEDFEDVGHSKNAEKTMEAYYIGELEGGAVEQNKPASSLSGSGGGFSILSLLQILLPVLIAALVLAVNNGYIEIPSK